MLDKIIYDYIFRFQFFSNKHVFLKFIFKAKLKNEREERDGSRGIREGT